MMYYAPGVARTGRTIRRRHGSKRLVTCTSSTKVSTRVPRADLCQPEKAADQAGRRLRRLPRLRDYETGRVVQAVEDLGKLDNTIIIYISGDNGASAEGSAMGTWERAPAV